MAASPSWVGTPKAWVGQVVTANTNRDGTGTIATIVTAGSGGSRIDWIEVAATGTTTAGVIRLYIHDGSNARLWKEVLVAAITPSTTQAVWSAFIDLTDAPLVLQSGYSLRASTEKAETFNVHASGGDF